MADRIRFDRSPSDAFADRLERDLLRVISARPTGVSTTTSPQHSTASEEDQLMTINLDSETSATTRQPRTTLKWLAVAAATIALVAAIAATTSDRQSDDTAAGPGGSPVNFVVQWEYSEVQSVCSLGSTRCLNHFDIPATTSFTGDVAGNGLQALYWNDSVDFPGQSVDHLEHVGTYLVTAEVSGCGSGQFMLVELMQFVSGPDRDRDSGTYKGTWQIVDGSGRGALADIAGSGTSEGIFGTAGDTGRNFTGTINCPTE
jgi:hypothetical protein